MSASACTRAGPGRPAYREPCPHRYDASSAKAMRERVDDALVTEAAATTALLFAMNAGADSGGPSGGEPQARSLRDLLDWVRLGETVYVRATSGNEVKGKIEGISANNRALLLRADDGRLMRIPEDWLDRIDLEFDDPIGNGALGGLGDGLSGPVGLCAPATAAQSEHERQAEGAVHTVLGCT